MSGIAVHPVTPERWPDMVELFERRGPRGGRRNVPAYGCWCMYWRDRSLGHGTPKKRAMGNLVRKGREPGLLAGAIEHARARGAAQIEAYGHGSDPSNYMGGRTLFRSHGFGSLREAPRRTVLRLDLA